MLNAPRMTTKPIAALILALSLAGCGGQISGSPEDAVSDTRQEESAYLEWWNAPFTYQSMSYGWHDTDLAVSSSTPIQLRHASRLTAWGIYGWGYMPTFVDVQTGYTFRFLHLRPQHTNATEIGHVYPAGYIVGPSGGDTHDTGLGVYSTGAHLCVQTPGNEPFRTAFPAGSDGGASAGGGGCHSATLNREVGAGTCVQSASDANWYECENGAWMSGRPSCGASYAWCHSGTLNKDVPPRTCVQSKYDHIWYQCDANGWQSGVANGQGPIGSCSASYHL